MTRTLSPVPALSSPRDVLTDFRLSAIGIPVHRTRQGPAAGPPATAEPAVPLLDVVEEWGMQSFPASDPPSNW